MRSTHYNVSYQNDFVTPPATTVDTLPYTFYQNGNGYYYNGYGGAGPYGNANFVQYNRFHDRGDHPFVDHGDRGHFRGGGGFHGHRR